LIDGGDVWIKVVLKRWVNLSKGKGSHRHERELAKRDRFGTGSFEEKVLERKEKEM
jgi:hypothetical protein